MCRVSLAFSSGSLVVVVLGVVLVVVLGVVGLVVVLLVVVSPKNVIYNTLACLAFKQWSCVKVLENILPVVALGSKNHQGKNHGNDED